MAHPTASVEQLLISLFMRLKSKGDIGHAHRWWVKLCPPYIQNIGYILSEVNFEKFCLEKPTPLNTNVLARFHAFCFSCDSCRNQTSFYRNWRNQRHGKWNGTMT